MKRRADDEKTDIALQKLMLSLGLESSGKPTKNSPILPSVHAKILKRDNWTCYYCGEKLEPGLEEVDHRVPRAVGGSDSPENLVTSCWYCNRAKRDLLIERLRFTPEQAREVLFRLVENPENRIIKRRVDALMTGKAIICEDCDPEEHAMERLVGVIEIRRLSIKLREAKRRRREKGTAAFSCSGRNHSVP
jgi:hypothetical protein